MEGDYTCWINPLILGSLLDHKASVSICLKRALHRYFMSIYVRTMSYVRIYIYMYG